MKKARRRIDVIPSASTSDESYLLVAASWY